jgi:hypothetical protein
MINVKDRMTAEFAMDAERRRGLARINVGAQANKPSFPIKAYFPATEGQMGASSHAPASGGFIANRTLANFAGGKSSRPAAHGHSRHK